MLFKFPVLKRFFKIMQVFFLFLQKNLRMQGDLRCFTLRAIGISFTLFLILGGAVYISTHQMIQKDAQSLSLHIQKVFYGISEETLEELIRFGKKQYSTKKIEIQNDKNMTFNEDISIPSTYLFHWVLRFEMPKLGTDGLWVIPTSVAILDDTGKKEIGQLTQHVNLRKLTEKIRSQANRFGMLFSIVDPRFGAISQSENSPGDHKSLIFKDILAKNPFSGSSVKSLFIKWPYQDATFLTLRRLERTPYIVLTGVQTSHFLSLVISRLGILFPYFLSSLFVLLILLWNFGHVAQYRFKQYQNLLRKHLTRVCAEIVTELFETAQKPLSKHPIFRSKDLNVKPNEKCLINREIQDALLLLDVCLTERGISVSLDLIDHMPELEIDPFVFQKIIVNLLQQSIETSKEGSKIFFKTTQTHSNVTISVTDRAFFLSKEDRLHFSKFHTNSIGYLDFNTIQELIESLSGTLTISACHPRGNHVVVEIPKNPISKPQNNNIISFKSIR